MCKCLNQPQPITIKISVDHIFYYITHPAQRRLAMGEPASLEPPCFAASAADEGGGDAVQRIRWPTSAARVVAIELPEAL